MLLSLQVKKQLGIDTLDTVFAFYKHYTGGKDKKVLGMFNKAA